MLRSVERERGVPAGTSTSRLPNGGIVVATDGTPESDGSVRIGIALSRREGVPIALLSVVEPVPVHDADALAIPDADRQNGSACNERDAALQAQRDRTHPGAPAWPCTIEVGDRVESTIAAAERTGASLIILGIGAHGVAARLFHRETALRVIRAARMPVLAVPHSMSGVPYTVLAAVDSTTSSEHAARAALQLLGRSGKLFLAHVSPSVSLPYGDPQLWDEIALTEVVPKLQAIARRLDPPPGVEVEYTLLRGDPARELLAFADQRHVDLISAGAHGRTALGRLVLGGVSTKLVRTAKCCVLIAPPCDDEPSHGESVEWT